MTHQILMPALIGSHPLAALASFGLLRVVHEWDPSAKLGFVLQDDWITYLESSQFDSLESLMPKLVEWIGSEDQDRLLDWASDIRVEPNVYKCRLDEAIDQGDIAFAAWLSALAGYGAQDKQKGLIKPSAFYMVSGQQSFLKRAREILVQLRASPAPLILEALQGPWTYQTPLHSLGWDPNTERLHALRSRAPTSEDPSCIAAAILLTMHALPLYPVVSDMGRAYTTGFRRNKERENLFSWPIFSTPLGLPDLRSLVQTAAWKAPDKRLRNGVAAVFSSRRSEFGQGYAVFRAAQIE